MGPEPRRKSPETPDYDARPSIPARSESRALMSLEFVDFAHYYEGSGLTEARQREHFEIYACLMESIVQLFWQDDPAPNRLGISFDKNTLRRFAELDSLSSLSSNFKDAAREEAAGKIAHAQIQKQNQLLRELR
jgi:hypothetical protein